ncbi:acetaldehyde dehydrogenase, partial [Listeria monocytogenes]
LVNTPGALGGIGATTNLVPALTLGCGAVGGSSSSDNIGPENLFNIRRIATGVLELEDIRKEENQATSELPVDADALIQSLVEKVLAELK